MKPIFIPEPARAATRRYAARWLLLAVPLVFTVTPAVAQRLTPSQQIEIEQIVAGNTAYEQRNFTQAVNLWSRMWRLERFSRGFTFRYGVALYRIGRLEEARHALAEAARGRRWGPRSDDQEVFAEANFVLGVIAEDLGSPDVALARYQESAEYGKVLAHIGAGRMLLDRSDPRGAAEPFSLAYERLPAGDDRSSAANLAGIAWHRLGSQEEQAGRLAEARTAYENALRYGPPGWAVATASLARVSAAQRASRDSALSAGRAAAAAAAATFRGAIARGDVAAVRALIEQGARLTDLDSSGRSPLHLAVLSPARRRLVPEMLPRSGPAINLGSADGRTALMFAAIAGDQIVADQLLAAGADHATRDRAGKTAATLAAENARPVLARHLRAVEAVGPVSAARLIAALDSPAVVQRILAVAPSQANASHISGTPLSNAVVRGADSAVALLLPAGARLEERDRSGRTPLHLAATAGHERVVRRLLAAGAEVGARDSSGQTALHAAITITWGGGRREIIGALIASRSPLEERDAQDRTPLWLALNPCHADYVRQLGAAGANLESRRNHQTPLIYAVRDRETCLQPLLEAGANPNGRDLHNTTALHYAAYSGSTAMVTALLEKGADLRLTDSLGRTPMHLAGSTTAVLLLDRGADVNALSPRRGTPLHTAVGRGDTATVQVLRARGADLAIRDSLGRTPLELASDDRAIPMVRALRLRLIELLTAPRPN